MNESDLEVIPVHVMRHPQGRARSLRKRNARGYVGTLTYTWRSLRIFVLLYRKPHIVVDYDALAGDPERQFTRLMERLDLAFEEGAAALGGATAPQYRRRGCAEKHAGQSDSPGQSLG